MTVYGQIITGKMVRDAVKSTLTTWLPSYLAEVSDLSGRARTDLPMFRSYAVALDLDKFEEDQSPSCVIVAPGIASDPTVERGKYTARWSVGLGCVVVGQDRDNTLELAELYAATVRALLVQKGSLGGFAHHVDWVGERYDELGTEDLRTIAAGMVQFLVTVESTVDRHGGPGAPVLDPAVEPPDWGTVDTVTITTKQRV